MKLSFTCSTFDVHYENRIHFQKTVRYWLARLVDSDAVKLSDEHQKMKWAPVDEAIHIAQFEDIGKLFRKAEEFLQSKQSA